MIFSCIRSSGALLAALALLSSRVSADESILGVYVFHRHGDRVSKSTPPAHLTDLGYNEVFASGTRFHHRYIDNRASTHIVGMQSELVQASQLSVSSAVDNVLQPSRMGWLQGLYPPIGSAASQTLRNGTTVEAPLNGYQIVSINPISSGSTTNTATWLQGATACGLAQVSSNSYFSSAEYRNVFSSTYDLYQSLLPVVNETFSAAYLSYKNAYAIWDLLNVAMIHNSTTTSPALSQVDDAKMKQLMVLSNMHEYALAYNASDSVRAIAGAVLAAQVVEALNATITSGGKVKLNVQFGAYGTFLSYFGLTQLPLLNADFTGIPDYASSMSWELVTNATIANESFPTVDKIGVRFLFHNGTSSTSDEPISYPLFGQSQTVLPWSQFVSQTRRFGVFGQAQWCQACGNTTGVCASSSSSSDSSYCGSSSKSHGGMSKALAGAIGALVTLAVILNFEVLIMLVFGVRLTKKRVAATSTDTEPVEEEKK